MVRFRIDYGNGHIEYVLNKRNNQIWFPVYRGDTTDKKDSIKLSEYRLLNENGNFNFILKEGSYLSVFSGHETDLIIRESLDRTRRFYLKHLPGIYTNTPHPGSDSSTTCMVTLRIPDWLRSYKKNLTMTR